MSEVLFCLMGPTTSGKTSLACELVSQFPFEIVSVDSAMIYRGMTIGTAKPDADTLARAPHHLIDLIDPVDQYSAAQFCHDVHRTSQEIIQRGRWPLLVGGTMMYFNALQKGLSALPESDARLRATLLQQIHTQGLDSLYQQLLVVDPVSAAKIHPHDAQRIQRALEVYLLTQQPLSQIIANPVHNAPAYQFVNLLLMPTDRAWLHERIEQRFQQMLQAGFLAEVEALLAQWPLTATCPAMRCVGYRQAWSYLHGQDDYATFCAKGVAATRQLAKRQLTWLRHWPKGETLVADSPAVYANLVVKIQQILDNSTELSKT